MICKERVIVLKTIRYGEADLVVHGLNSRGAKFSLFAKSALKSKKRFAGGVLEPTHYIQVVFKQAQLAVIQEATLLEAFQGLRSNYDRLQLALYFLQVVGRLGQEGSDDPELFHLLGNALRASEKSDSLDLLRLHFDLKILAHQGMLPKQAMSGEVFQRGIQEHASLNLSSAQIKDLQTQSRALLQDYIS
jgi:DNA repair protein RecO (recombination protein O)